MKTHLNIQLLTAAILLLGGIALLFCGVWIDPQGQIHESLLIGFGEVATFAGALFGIDSVSGALEKPNKKSSQHACGDYLIGKHRTAATTNPQSCNTLYLFKADALKRSTPVTAEEIVARTRFAEVARAVNTRAHDLMQMTQDQAAFIAQKDQPGGKPTMKSYLWKLELAKYDANHNG